MKIIKLNEIKGPNYTDPKTKQVKNIMGQKLRKNIKNNKTASDISYVL